MSAPQPRLLETYNSLTDKHLVGYFSNARIRRHLQKAGLISRSGRIIPEKEYRLNVMRRDHQRCIHECLADAIFHKVLDMERHHHQEIKRRCKYPVEKEGMQPVEVERFRASLENVIHMHCPHPPLVSRSHCGLCPVVARERAGCSRWSAPRLGVGHGGGHCLHQHRIRELDPSKVGERPELRLMNSVARVSGVSPCQLPVLSPCPLPAPPARPRGGHGRVPAALGGPPVERRLHPTAASNEQLLIRNTRGYPKSPLCSNAFVTMIYLGKSKHVSLRDYMDEIKVYQQYCGTENICVYKGKLLEGDSFQFTSKRHLGFPFSLTFYLNGMQVERLSSCCEYRHQRRGRVRRANSYFRVLHVAGAPPCYRCIIAMGLDKKPSLPKRKIGYPKDKHMCCLEHALYSEPCDCSTEPKSSNSVLVTIPDHEASMETVGETLETGEESSKEETENQYSEESQDSQEDSSNDEYDEDFEADEEVNEEEQAGDQMNGMSESSSDDKKHNLNYEKESETSFQKALQASDSEKDESDGYSDDRDSEDDLQERRPTDSLSSVSTQCSTEADSHGEMMTDNVNCKEDCDIKSTSYSAAHAHYGNENGEKKLLRMEENQDTSAKEKKGIDEAEKTKPEDLTAREDTKIFHENIKATQAQNPDANGEFKQTGSGASNMNEEEECPPVPWESRVLNMEDGKEESPWCVFEDYKPVQEEMSKATGNYHPVNYDPEPGGLCASEEEKNAANTEHDASGAPDGSFSAEGRRSLDAQEAAGEAAGEGQEPGQGRALEPDGAAGGDAGVGEAGGKAAGNSLPQAGTGAVLRESVPEEHAKGEGTGEAVKLGTELSPGEQEVLLEGVQRGLALGKPAARGEGPAGALPGWEADRAMARGQEGAGGTTEEEKAAEEGLEGASGPPAEEEVGEPVSQASLGHGGSAGKDTMVGAVADGGEAVQDAAAADGVARAVGPEGEEAVEEDISEREEATEKPGALSEALEDMETGEAMPGGEGFVKPSEFSQLKESEEEWMEMGKAVAGAAAPESAQAWEVRGSAPRRVEDTMEKSVEPDKSPVLEVAPGLGALGSVRGDPVTEGSPQEEEETAAAQEEEGAAEALWSGNPSEGSKAETETAVEGKPEGEVVGGAAGAAGPGSGGEGAAGGAADSEEPAAGTGRRLRCGEVRGKGRSPGEGAAGEAGLCGTRAGEPGLVAIAVLGGQAGPGAPAPARGPARAGARGVGAGAMAREGLTGAVRGTQSGAGAAPAQEVPAEGRRPGGDGEGAADGPVAGGRAARREAAGGCEGRGAVPAQGRAEPERVGSPRHGEVLGTSWLGEQPAAETSPSTPDRGDGRVEPRGRESTGGEGLCLGARHGTGTVRGEAGRQEQGTERAGVEADGERPSPRENTGESQVADASAGAGCAAGAGERRRDGPAGGSRGPRQDDPNPDPLIMCSEQDGEESLL